MAVVYYVRQDKRRNGTLLWYGKAYPVATANLDYLAERIQAACAMKKSDVIAYLTELIDTIGRKIKSGYKVQLGDLGYFSLGMRTKGAVTEDKFNIRENVAGVTVRFETKNNVVNGVTTRAVFNNVSFKKIDNPFKKDEQPEP